MILKQEQNRRKENHENPTKKTSIVLSYTINKYITLIIGSPRCKNTSALLPCFLVPCFELLPLQGKVWYTRKARLQGSFHGI